ncbi:MAG: MBL fold metallo-hydrolase [Rhodospirillales bacterium]|nr:MBL fold metallo-hydrolase [Rhodospirillales bacterium]
MNAKITILGSGNSAGTPSIGNFWGNCDPGEPKNNRMRASIAVQTAKTTVIVDTGPDFRHQINRANIEIINAILYSHAHSDHVNGMDELRVIRNHTKSCVDIYSNRETLGSLEKTFPFLFINSENRLYPRVVEPHTIKDTHYGTPFMIGDIPVVPFEQEHGTIKSLGFRFGDVAYSTDMVDLDQQALETLSGVKTWIADSAAYKHTENPVHANLKKLYELNEVIQADRVIVTHMPPSMDYKTLLKELPEGFEPAYDGLEVDCTL